MKNKSNKKDLGDFGEALASSYLESQGFLILERNFRSPYGEIDIIATDKKTLVFVEVKLETKSIDRPSVKVNQKKQKRILYTALHYLEGKDWQGNIRFDILEINLAYQKKGKYHIQWIPDAFNPESIFPDWI
ncbi:MAG: YraN family protein [Planctomycetota bacterium]|nr:MAG: YraN family protein [Planctomycetota bacterium]